MNGRRTERGMFLRYYFLTEMNKACVGQGNIRPLFVLEQTSDAEFRVLKKGK